VRKLGAGHDFLGFVSKSEQTTTNLSYAPHCTGNLADRNTGNPQHWLDFVIVSESIFDLIGMEESFNQGRRRFDRQKGRFRDPY